METDTDPRVTQALKEIRDIFKSLSEKNQAALWCRMVLANPDLLEEIAKRENITIKEVKKLIRECLRRLGHKP